MPASQEKESVSVRVESGPLGVIKDIQPAGKLGSHGNEPVAIIEHDWEGGKADAWILVPEAQNFKVGDKVRMYSTVLGNLTIHSFDLVPEVNFEE